MAVKVALQNERTGEIKQVKVGWSWILFFFSGFLGIPLLLRKLYIWAALEIGIFLLNILIIMTGNPDVIVLASYATSPASFALSIFLGLKGNELTAKNYLESGWAWVDPDDQATVYAREKWALA